MRRIIDADVIEKFIDLLTNAAASSGAEADTDTFERRMAYYVGKAEGLAWAAQHLKLILDNNEYEEPRGSHRYNTGD